MTEPGQDGCFRGTTAVITGGGSGIGRAVATRFAHLGADVLVVGRTSRSLAETARHHPQIRTFAADITDPSAPTAIVAAAVTHTGRIDILVNNAAITRPAPLGEIDRGTLDAQIAVNLTAPLLLTQEALPYLAAQRGVIVNVTSNPPLRGWPNNSVYGATKVSLDFLTRTWAVELAPRGIRVVAVAPGITETPILSHAGLPDEQIAGHRERRIAHVPLRRAATAEEIAWWVVTVCGSQAGYLTGTVVRVDGGVGAV